jgi:outer membrane biosynthesis protein TonB
MKKIWMRSVSVVAVSLLIGACGKSKDSSSSVSVAPAAGKSPIEQGDKPETAPPVQEPGGGNPEQNPGKNPGQKPDQNKNDKDKNGQDQNKGRIRTPVQEKGGKPSKGENKPEQKPESKPEQKPDPRPDQKPDQKPGKPDNTQEGKPGNQQQDSRQNGDDSDVLSEEQIAALLKKADQYSGAADDGLRAYLRVKQDQISDSRSRSANIKFASQIQRARLKISTAQRTVGLKMILQNEEVTLTGALQSDRSAMLNGRAGSTRITGKVLCFDRATSNRACSTNVVSLEMSGARAQIIVRNTALSMDTVFPEHNCMTPACQNFYIFFRFTEVDLINSKTMKQAQMESFEVIQGRSGFKVLAVSNGGEVFTMAGPLLKPSIAQNENRPADTTLDADDLVDENGEIRKTSLNEALGDVRILGNDGRGNIHLSIKIGSQDGFRLGLNRKVPETRTVIDDGYQVLLK